MNISQSFDRMIMQFMRDDPLTAYYIKETQGVYNPATGEIENSVIVETPVSAIQLDLTRDNSGLSKKFGTEIIEGDKELYVLPPEKKNPTALPLTIDTAGDRIRIGNKNYKIVVMKEGNQDGQTTILYNFHIRL